MIPPFQCKSHLAFCACGLHEAHAGPHLCACAGSWSGDGESAEISSFPKEKDSIISPRVFRCFRQRDLLRAVLGEALEMLEARSFVSCDDGQDEDSDKEVIAVAEKVRAALQEVSCGL